MANRTNLHDLIWQNPHLRSYTQANYRMMQTPHVNAMLHCAVTLLTLSPRGLCVSVTGEHGPFTVTLDPHRNLLLVDEYDSVIQGSIEDVCGACIARAGSILGVSMSHIEEAHSVVLYASSPSGKRRGGRPERDNGHRRARVNETMS